MPRKKYQVSPASPSEAWRASIKYQDDKRVRNWKFGFSLIELMIVVTLIGIASSLVTASFLTFERSNRVKNAALALKGDLRFVQNKALSGDKGPQGVSCGDRSILGGWYLVLEKDQNFYTFGGLCVDVNLSPPYASERLFLEKVVNLPQGTKIEEIYSGTNAKNDAAVFFKPLSKSVSFHIPSLALDANPNFFRDETGVLINPLDFPPQSPLRAVIADLEGGRRHQVKVQLSGEISDEKL